MPVLLFTTGIYTDALLAYIVMDSGRNPDRRNEVIE